MSNTQEATWTWASQVDRFDRMLSPFDALLADAARVGAGDRVLDVGCGAGATALRFGEIVGPSGVVIGIDMDPELVAIARRRAANTRHVAFVTADAATCHYVSGFDAAVSRFGMMLFDDPPAAFRHIAGVVRCGGRIVYTTWTDPEANAWFAIPYQAAGVPVDPQGRPFRLGDPDANVTLLDQAGCVDVTVDTVEQHVWLGEGVDDVGEMLRARIAHESGADTGAVDAVVTAARRLLEPFATDDGVIVTSRALVCAATVARTEGPSRR